MRKLVSATLLALAATALSAAPAVATDAAPNSWVWHLKEQHISLSQCDLDGAYWVQYGGAISGWCDFHDAGANDNLWALWLAYNS